MKKTAKVLVAILFIAVIVVGYFLIRQPAGMNRNVRVVQWIRNPTAHPKWSVPAKTQCNGAPFLMPTSGYIGFLWDDSFRIGHRHQGIDVFGGEQPGLTPVYSAYPGYLTRLPEWKSSLIIRIPKDPLQPDRQIWTYYTHLADAEGHSYISSDFPPGTTEDSIPAGTLLGYQGNYSGDPDQPVGVHLHFSIVQDDLNGRFRNELEISNTLDPSPYLGLTLNAKNNPAEIITCISDR